MTDMREALERLDDAARGFGWNSDQYRARWAEVQAALAAPGEPVAWPTEPTREMCEAMPVLPALTQDDLRFKALGWPMHAIQNRHRLIAALAVAPASPRALDVEEARVRSLLEAIRDNNPNDMAADAVTCGMVWQKEATDILMRVPARSPSLEEMVADEWQSLLDKDDRTSPEEYPDMVLITHDELREFAAAIAKGSK